MLVVLGQEGIQRLGRLQLADILLEPKITPEEVAVKGSWSD